MPVLTIIRPQSNDYQMVTYVDGESVAMVLTSCIDTALLLTGMELIAAAAGVTIVTQRVSDVAFNAHKIGRSVRPCKTLAWVNSQLRHIHIQELQTKIAARKLDLTELTVKIYEMEIKLAALTMIVQSENTVLNRPPV